MVKHSKRYLLNWLINKIYNSDKEKIKEYVMYVNCCSIRFKDNLYQDINVRIFAKRFCAVNNNGKIFKSIILSNAENLTNDAQSALRRCIETFSHKQDFLLLLTFRKIFKPNII